MKAPSAQLSNEAKSTKDAFSSSQGKNIRAWPQSLLLCETRGSSHGQQGPCCLLSIFVCSLHSWKRRMAFCLKRYLMDIYAAVRLWREPLISFFRLHIHIHTIPVWNPEQAIIGSLQDKWTHICTHYPQRCSAVYPHQCGVDLGAWPCDLGGNETEVMVKINPGNWVNSVCTPRHMALTNQTSLSWEKKKWKSSLWRL